MSVTRIIDSFGYVIYAALAFLAVWGGYNAILLYRSLGKKTLKDPQPLILQVQELCQARKFDVLVVSDAYPGLEYRVEGVDIPAPPTVDDDVQSKKADASGSK